MLSRSLKLLDEKKFKVIHEVVEEEMQGLLTDSKQSIWEWFHIDSNGKTCLKPPWKQSLDENKVLLNELKKLEQNNFDLSKKDERDKLAEKERWINEKLFWPEEQKSQTPLKMPSVKSLTSLC